jgi:hypothetical protein
LCRPCCWHSSPPRTARCLQVSRCRHSPECRVPLCAWPGGWGGHSVPACLPNLFCDLCLLHLRACSQVPG